MRLRSQFLSRCRNFVFASIYRIAFLRGGEICVCCIIGCAKPQENCLSIGCRIIWPRVRLADCLTRYLDLAVVHFTNAHLYDRHDIPIMPQAPRPKRGCGYPNRPSMHGPKGRLICRAHYLHSRLDVRVFEDVVFEGNRHIAIDEEDDANAELRPNRGGKPDTVRLALIDSVESDYRQIGSKHGPAGIGI